MFYNRFQAACKAKGIVMTQLLKELGMSPGNLSNWKGGRMPSTDVLNTLALRLDTTTDYLLGMTDDPTPVDQKETALDGMDNKEILRQALIRSGIIPADHSMSEEESKAILAYAETYFKRN